MIDSIAIDQACTKLGWNGLRPVQEEVLTHVLAGKNVIAVLPTSAGKSGIYQVPTLAREGMTIVISPLVALMQDQVSRLQRHGVEAVSLNSHCSALQKRQYVDKIKAGAIKLLYVSPEKMMSLDPSMFETVKIQMYAIDEAHCISEWGHDFRPSYYRLGRSIARFPPAQKLALTATATEQVVNEIASVLGVENDVVRICHSPDRPNIAYGVAGQGTPLVSLVQAAGLPCLVYGSTRKSVEDAANQLVRSNFKAAYYHAGMLKNDRSDVQSKFESGYYDVISATCAFGLGIDHPGIRSVVHLEMPTSLEAYSQETGRAGRDGGNSKAICRATVDTLEIAKSAVASVWPYPIRIRLFWERISPLFSTSPDHWHGDGRIQYTDEELSHLLGMENAIETASCLRILSESGNMRVIPYRDRPVRVTLLSGADRVRGSRQHSVVEKLKDHADISGEVVGSVSFFSEEIGLDKTYARELSNRNIVRMDWVSQCQVIEKLVDGEPNFDEDRVVRVHMRSLARIDAAKGFMYNNVGCRRKYLLSYFGDNREDPSKGATGICCDLCKKKLKT